VITTVGANHIEMPPGSYWPILLATFFCLTFISFMAGSGGGKFDYEAFKLQVLIQGPVVLAMLFCLLAWIREDDTPR